MMAWKIEAARALPGYRLAVTFADGLSGVTDLSDVPHVGVFAPWADHAYFEQVRVDPQTWTVCWPNGADVAPDSLYDDIKRQRGAAA